MWACPWYHPKSTIFSCGSFPNVPLMGPRGCIAYTPAIVLRQLRWTQVRPKEEQLGGLSFQYDGTNTVKQQAEIRAAWNNIQRVGEKELGKPKITASMEYKEWRESRGVCDLGPKEINQGDGNSLEVVARMTSQLEMMKAQMRALESEKEGFEVQVECLKRKVQLMGKEIEHLQDECADAYENPSQAKRARKGKEKESEIASLSARKMQEKIVKQERLIATMLQEKEKWETDNSVQKQRIEALQRALNEAHLQADRGWASAKKYHDSLIIANKSGERLRQDLQKLEMEREQWKWEAQRQEQEKNEWVGGWRYEAEFQEAEKMGWMKKYGDMSANFKYHATQWANHFDEADAEVRADPWLKIPLKITEFMNYCRSIAKGFRKKKMNLLM